MRPELLIFSSTRNVSVAPNSAKAVGVVKAPVLSRSEPFFANQTGLEDCLLRHPNISLNAHQPKKRGLFISTPPGMEMPVPKNLGRREYVKLNPTEHRLAIALIVPQPMVKTVKDAVEAHGKLNKLTKIQPHEFSSSEPEDPRRYCIPTTDLSAEDAIDPNSAEPKRLRLAGLDLQHLAGEITVTTTMLTQKTLAEASKASSKTNKLASVVNRWLHSLHPSHVEMPAAYLSCSRWSYIIYPPMLLLPSTTFSVWPWPQFLCSLPQRDLSGLYDSICTAFKITHLALDGPIPSTSGTKPNMLRSPSNLTPLHGDFGPALAPPPEHNPTQSDFDNAFWCSTFQNGIVQVWAPRHTMFSRGNLSEKKRVLDLESLTRSGLGGRAPGEISAVDLYAGIGYFAFSYMKAGVGKVLCWELNPWSVEGMRRGATKNGWNCGTVKDDDNAIDGWREGKAVEGKTGEQEILIFEENNERAAEKLARMRDCIPPVRHVNCGFLPTSSDSWATAVRALDPVEGGWVHAHENVRASDTGHRKGEIVKRFEELAQTYRLCQRFRIGCSHVETVKSYGPAINHVVFDIAILPPTPR